MSDHLPNEFLQYAPAYLRDELTQLEQAHRDLAQELRANATCLLEEAAIHEFQAKKLKELNSSEHPSPEDDYICEAAVQATGNVMHMLGKRSGHFGIKPSKDHPF